jgi:hypothetical protein
VSDTSASRVGGEPRQREWRGAARARFTVAIQLTRSVKKRWNRARCEHRRGPPHERVDVERQRMVAEEVMIGLTSALHSFGRKQRIDHQARVRPPRSIPRLTKIDRSASLTKLYRSNGHARNGEGPAGPSRHGGSRLEKPGDRSAGRFNEGPGPGARARGFMVGCGVASKGAGGRRRSCVAGEMAQ